MVYSNTAVCGGNECGKSDKLVYFYFFEAANSAFEAHFSGLHFYALSKTLIACIGPYSSDFFFFYFKVELRTKLDEIIFRVDIADG